MQGTRRHERLEGYALLPKVKLVESEWDLAHNSNMANWESEITQNRSRSWSALGCALLQWFFSGRVGLCNVMNGNGIDVSDIGRVRLKSSMRLHVIVSS